MKIYEIVFVCKKKFVKYLYNIINNIKLNFNNCFIKLLFLGERKLSYKINNEKKAKYYSILIKYNKKIIYYIKKKIKYKKFLLRYIILKTEIKNILYKFLE
ncbi:30S ribosomal protein S6 [Candidatus Vidania fulgoroideorum]